MKKLKIIGIIVGVIALGGLLFFISTHKFEDSHLRKEGIRVKMADNTLITDNCNEKTKNATFCEREIKVEDDTAKFIFEYKDFKESGYPSTFVATINGHEFYKKEDLDLEKNGSLDYTSILNFHVFDNKIITFTLTEGNLGRKTTLYGIDLDGNIILKETAIDKDDMLIKDYEENYITYDKNMIKIYATRVVANVRYQDTNICNVAKNTILEAYYTYTYNNGKFTKKQTETINTAKFIKNKEMICNNK